MLTMSKLNKLANLIIFDMELLPIWITLACSVTAILFKGCILGPSQVITMKTKTFLFFVQPSFLFYLKFPVRAELKPIDAQYLGKQLACFMNTIATDLIYQCLVASLQFHWHRKSPD